jgi:hypothetical protein
MGNYAFDGIYSVPVDEECQSIRTLVNIGLNRKSKRAESWDHA